jgi:hypothetical protein
LSRKLAHTFQQPLFILGIGLEKNNAVSKRYGVLSSEVGSGSREENTTEQGNLQSFRFNLNRKDSIEQNGHPL